ncbi:MAG: rhodanese-like domain-containing protein [Thermoplasmata archaeon]
MATELSPERLAEKLRGTDDPVFLLDVREPDERELAHIEPSHHIPMREVPQRLIEIPRDREVVVYCHAGGRSATIVAYLESRGYSQVANLHGGIDAWSIRVDPNVPRYG